MKTNVKLQVTHDGRSEYCRVKLDKNKFPYIIISNEKMIINSTEFPRRVKFLGLWDLIIEIISGLEELESILKNPDLTVDKISFKQQMRIG